MPVGGGCVARGILNLGCPPGTTHDGFGRCCPDLLGGLGQCPDPPPTYFCGDVIPETDCPVYFINDNNCYSPVLLDIAGDGFSMTGASAASSST
jgi:hypothetical protein